MFDCLILGAGPAGAAAAYHLARRGHSVLLIEKDRLPRYKACGGGVSPIVAEWFDFDFSPAIEHGVNRLRFTWKMDDPVEADLPSEEPFWMVKRDRFDQFLVEQAVAAGVQIEDGCPALGLSPCDDGWEVETSRGRFQGRYLIAADGAEGPAAGWLGFPVQKRNYARALELEVPLDHRPDSTAHFEFGLVKNGYIWMFPKASGYSVGIGTFRGQEETDFLGLLAEYLPSHGLSLSDSEARPARLNIWNGHIALHGRRCLLAGDAAAVTDPFTAEGIRPALLTGVRAAEAIAAALGGDSNALADYSQRIRREWGDSMAWGKRIAQVFYRVPSIGYQIGIKRPTAPQRMAQILVGEQNYGDIAGRVIRRLTTSFLPGGGR